MDASEVPAGVAPEWHQLAAHVRARREILRLTQAQAATAANIAPRTWSLIEKPPVRSCGPRKDTAAAVETVLGWMPGSIRSVLAGGPPVLDPTPRAPAPRTGLTDDQIAAISWRISRSIDDIVTACITEALRAGAGVADAA
jgi:DNA-binding XRE family transcriptional regulator